MTTSVVRRAIVNDPIKITDAERAVMDVLWDQAPRSAAEIIESLSARSDWSHRTIRTLLARLVKKGALSAEGEGRRYFYEPLVSRERFLAEESENFVSRVFGGDAKALVMHFVESEDLRDSDIVELERLLRGKKGRARR